jgi:threonine dehydrogenase-like Zn-dependent dehydrogenase
MPREVSNVLVSPKRLELQEFPVPQILDPEDAVLRVEMVGVCGGDVIEYQGHNFKAHYPMILGHEVVGFIEAIGPNAKERYGVDVGFRVVVEPYILCRQCRYCLTGLYQFCQHSKIYGVNMAASLPPYLWGAYGEYMYVAPGSRVHIINSTVDARAACLTSVMGNGVRWVRTLGRLNIGESILILGSGAQGLASIIVAKSIGAKRITCVAQKTKVASVALAQELGAEVIFAEDLPQEPPTEYDVAVDCTGVDAMVNVGIRWLTPRGRLILAGTRGGRQATVSLDDIVFKELQVFGGLGQSWDTELAADIINHQQHPIHKMISHVLPVREAQQALEAMSENRTDIIHLALQP